MFIGRDYPFSNWLTDLSVILQKREFLNKETALGILVEGIEDFRELWLEGMMPMAAYREYSE